MSKPIALSWDYREQPDLDELARIIRDMSGGTVHLHQVETGSDQYGIVLAPQVLDEQGIADAWNHRWDDEE